MYSDALRLELATGRNVAAVVRSGAAGSQRPRCLLLHGNPGSLLDWSRIVPELARHPQRVAGIVLIGTLGAPAHASYRLLALPGATAFARATGGLFRSQRLAPLGRVVLRGAMKPIFSPEPLPEKSVDQQLELFSRSPEVLLSMVHVALGQPSRKLLDSASAIQCPALFLHGQRDALVPSRCARTIHERIESSGGRSRFELVPGAGHMLLEFQAQAMAASIAQFVA
ncbi:MAG TPA: alpha/beta hydrolase [Polyangiaceae bacterium]|jgi:pimeloyl-ACP methyl ester carboxylesterase|nr:alpha/beta hydrolase [Polyangiaceae bacterium]